MINKEEEEKKKKWKGQIWDKEEKKWVKEFQIPKQIDSKDYQHYQYTEGYKYLQIAKKLKRNKDRESDVDLSQMVKSEPPAYVSSGKKNYLNDE